MVKQIKLKEILKEYNIIYDAFEALKDFEMMQAKMDSKYSIIDVKQDFMILEENRVSLDEYGMRYKEQLLHPYGSPISYLFKEKPVSKS
ncbi:MAG: hypothetical protein WC781_04920 [Candidatus Pacearchaeota archaeon]|jgi:hypothetical protein